MLKLFLTQMFIYPAKYIMAFYIYGLYEVNAQLG